MRIVPTKTWPMSCRSKEGAACIGLNRPIGTCAGLMNKIPCAGVVFVLSKRSKVGRFHFPVDRRKA